MYVPLKCFCVQKEEKFPEYFMMGTVVYTNNSAEIAGAVVEILVGGARIESRQRA